MQQAQTNPNQNNQKTQNAQKTQKTQKSFRENISKYIGVNSDQFQSILPYHAYDEATGLFINDSSVGFGYELGSFAGANEELVNKIISFINEVVTDDGKTIVKIMRWCNNKVGARLDIIKEQTSAFGGVYETLAQSADDYYRYAALEKFPNPTKLPVCLRDNRLFAFFSKEIGTKRLEDLMDELLRLRDDVESDFKSNTNFPYRRLEVRDFVSLIRDLLSPDQDDLYYQTANDYSPELSIKDQVKGANFEMLINKKDIDIGVDRRNGDRSETKITNFYIGRYPSRFALWQNADCFANVWKTHQSITGSYIFTVTFCVETLEKSQAIAQNKYMKLDKYAKSQMLKWLPSLGKAAQEWDAIRQEVNDDKRRIIYCQPSLTLFSPKDKARDQVSEAISCFGSSGFHLVAAQFLQMPLFLAIFPFLHSEGLWVDLSTVFKLARPMRSSEVASLLPVVGDFIVSRTGVLMPTFRHQLSCFSQFSEDLMTDNLNIAVAASSGSGKSFLVQALAMDVLSRGGRVWIIDKGISYRKICHTLNGTYLDATKLSLNPFSNVEKIENEAPLIRNLIAVMASPSGELSDVQLAHLLTAVNSAWNKKQKEATIDLVVEGLKELSESQNDRRIADMVVLLQKYTIAGQYGRYFNYPSMLNRNEKFTVLELGGFEQNDELLRPVLFALIMTIQEQMFNSPRNVPKMCIIDEAWALLQGENKQAKHFIETGYRTARKHGGSFCTITQGLRDFFVSSESEAIWDNSAIKFILKQQDLSALKLTRNGQEILTTQEQMVVREFPPAKIGFSSILIKAGDYASFNRFFVDPFKRILLSTEAKQFEAVDTLCKEGMSLTDAITNVTRKYYGAELDLINKRVENLQGDHHVY